MPAQSKLSHLPHRRDLGDRPPVPGKPSYCPEVQLAVDHPCLPSDQPVFSASNDMWQRSCPDLLERHDWSPAEMNRRPASPSTTSSRTTPADLARLSSRPYPLRVADRSDFASVWETSIVPLLTDLLQRHCTSDFTVDVHNFPEMPGNSVPRVIYITFPVDTPQETSLQLEQIIRSELARAVPDRFSSPLYLKFRRGSPRRSNPSASWWGDRERGDRDHVCEPKNVTYRATPVIGMSIGPARVRDAAASLGGFVQVGSEVYAMSAFHPFEDSIETCHLRVSHPAEPDFPAIVPADPGARPYSIGNVAMWAPCGTLRPSLTFFGTGFRGDLTMVEMDWCLIGPVANGKNFVSVPSFQMERVVAVQNVAAVEGNTEVYAMARTSGYSLGFTSDVPGLQRICGRLRREWTVRQYSPFKHPRDNRASAPWQTLKQWVTSGIGVPGDSGAWLIRRSDDALMGLIWGRNHDSGNPLERVRLTYFTPIIDILADVREKHAPAEDVALPAYTAGDLRRHAGIRHPRDAVQDDMAQDPWTIFSREAVERNRHAQVDLIQSHFVDGGVSASGAALGRYRENNGAEEPEVLPSTSHSPTLGCPSSAVAYVAGQTTTPRSEGGGTVSTLRSQEQLLLGLGGKNGPSLPALSTSSSLLSGSNSVDESSEVASRDGGIRIVGEGDIAEDVTDIVEEPIRSKALFSHGYPDVSRYGPVTLSPEKEAGSFCSV